jgi:hypothetical protein
MMSRTLCHMKRHNFRLHQQSLSLVGYIYHIITSISLLLTALGHFTLLYLSAKQSLVF